MHWNLKHSSQTRCSLEITSVFAKDASQNTPYSKLMDNLRNS